MTATMAAREIGFPWFERHARKGCREIVQYSTDPFGWPLYQTRINGAVWADRDTMNAFYHAHPGPEFPMHEIYRMVEEMDDGLRERRLNFATWEEAEIWLLTKDGER